MTDENQGSTGTGQQGSGNEGASGSEGTGQAAGNEGQQGQQGQEGASGVPEKYELKLPEGALLKPDAIERTALTAKSLGLSNEVAQKTLEYASAEVKAYQDGLLKGHEEAKTKWASEAKADKEIAGEKGDEFDKNVELAHRAFKHFAGEDFTKVVNELGYGNHPALVKTFMKIGKAMAEDSLVSGNQGGQETDPAKRLFPEMK